MKKILNMFTGKVNPDVASPTMVPGFPRQSDLGDRGSLASSSPEAVHGTPTRSRTASATSVSRSPRFRFIHGVSPFHPATCWAPSGRRHERPEAEAQDAESRKATARQRQDEPSQRSDRNAVCPTTWPRRGFGTGKVAQASTSVNASMGFRRRSGVDVGAARRPRSRVVAATPPTFPVKALARSARSPQRKRSEKRVRRG
jgi:hypothetical protein